MPLLEQISNALKISVEAFKNFDEVQTVNIIANTFGDHAFGNSFNYGAIHFHPVEELIKLHEEKSLFTNAC